MNHKNKKINFSNGFSLVEVLLAVAIFALAISAIFGAIIYGQESSALAGKRARATYLASEGLEAVRNIRDENYCNLDNGYKGLGVSAGQWEFIGTFDTSPDGSFNRQINISNVNSNTKLVTSSVTWQQNLQRNGEVALSSYLTKWPFPLENKAMMVYAKLADSNIPYYRIWDSTTSSWGPENAANAVPGLNIQYIMVKYSRTRNEAILGTLDSAGNIVVQVWNGCGWGEMLTVSNIGTSNDIYRGFDIAYETQQDRAIIVYNDANAYDPSYRIWDGNDWLDEQIVPVPANTRIPRWIELEANPKSDSNEMAMMLLDSRNDVYGMGWNGSDWFNLNVTSTWDQFSSTSARKAMDIAYEQNSGRAMFLWGSTTVDTQYYRLWSGGSAGVGATASLPIGAMNGTANWSELVARPGSNEIMYAVQDSQRDLNTRKWDGEDDEWDTETEHHEHDASTEAANSKNFDIIYETYPGNSGKAWLVWGNDATVTAKQWSGSSWNSASTLSGSDDTSFIKLNAKPNSGEIFCGAYESQASGSRNDLDQDDILEWHLTEGVTNWSSLETIWTGQTLSNPVYFRIDIDSR